LPYNTLVKAKVRAYNSMGWSSYSSVNTIGDTVKTEPSAPPTNPSSGATTSDAQIEINWVALTGADTGGDTIT